LSKQFSKNRAKLAVESVEEKEMKRYKDKIFKKHLFSTSESRKIKSLMLPIHPILLLSFAYSVKIQGILG
jgi:hypothetical protein